MNYSQNNEQQIIADYFGNFKGTYLDLGANDGMTLSNTYALYLKGWRGVNVEPSVEAYSRLCNNQPECDNILAAIGTEAGTMTMYESGEHLGKGDVSLLSTLKEEEVKRWNKETFKPVQVNVIKPVKWSFDLLSMDIEGVELEVLPLLDLATCKLAVIEWNGKHLAEFNEIMKGFTLLYTNAENLIYGRN